MVYALINKSTRVTKDEAIKMMAACQKQLTMDIAPAWGRVPASMVMYTDIMDVPPEAQPLILMDNSDQAGALGYHDETAAGRPYARIFAGPVLDNGGAVLAGADPSVVTVASVLSHEVAEQFCDTSCVYWADTMGVEPNGADQVALEVADPVEADGYTVMVGNDKVTVSNFVYPAWFDPKAPTGAKLDHMGTTHAPFTMSPGGYVIIRKDGNESQVFGSMRAEWRAGAKAHPASRTSKRSK